MAKARSPRLGLTQARRAAAVAAYARCGVFARVAEHLGVDGRTLRRWREESPDFDAELKAAGEQLDIRIGELARHKLEEYFESVGDMLVVEEKDTVSNQGKNYTEVRRQRVLLNPAFVRMALTKLDPDWVRAPLTKEEQDKVATYIHEVIAAREARRPKLDRAA